MLFAECFSLLNGCKSDALPAVTESVLDYGRAERCESTLELVSDTSCPGNRFCVTVKKAGAQD